MSLSVIVITKDEEQMIGRCLGSVRWADEIVVVDSGSTDGTRDICRGLGAQVHVTADWPGFGVQKNRALDLARGDWILSLDADEWLSPELQAELRELIRTSSPQVCAYRIRRRSSFCGHFMRHSGWWPDRVTRLFRRGKARFSDDAVHERMLVQGEVREAEGVILHEAFQTLEEVLGKMDRYSTAGAQLLATRNRRASVPRAVWHGLWAFFRTYVLRGGFLDGREGFMLSVSNAEGAYYKYVKLMLLRNPKSIDQHTGSDRQRRTPR
jgi:glycosyltransferase involved in cell wall biosynthesis